MRMFYFYDLVWVLIRGLMSLKLTSNTQRCRCRRTWNLRPHCPHLKGLRLQRQRRSCCHSHGHGVYSGPLQPCICSVCDVFHACGHPFSSLLFHEIHLPSASPISQEGRSLLRALCSGWQNSDTATEKLGFWASSRFFPLRGLRNRLARANTMQTRKRS